jgi:hypothetical protein
MTPEKFWERVDKSDPNGCWVWRRTLQAGARDPATTPPDTAGTSAPTSLTGRGFGGVGVAASERTGTPDDQAPPASSSSQPSSGCSGLGCGWDDAVL